MYLEDSWLYQCDWFVDEDYMDDIPVEQLENFAQVLLDLHQPTRIQTGFQRCQAMALSGFPMAETQMALCYLRGLGIGKNIGRVVYWSKRAAKHGDGQGAYLLATLYDQGLGIPQNGELAAKWYAEAKKRGYRPPKEASVAAPEGRR